MASDAVYLPVLPSFKDFQGQLSSGVKGAGKSAGDTIARELEQAVRRSERAIKPAADAAEKAHRRVATAAERVTQREIDLAKARESGNSDRIIRAEDNLAKAKRDQETATTAATRAEENHARKIQEAATARDGATSKLDGYSKALDRQASAENKVDAAQAKVETTTQSVVRAQQGLNDARESGDPLKQAEAELDLEKAQRLQAEASADAAKEAQNLATAKQDAESAGRAFEKSQDDLAVAASQAGGSIKDLASEADGAGDALDDLGGKGEGLGDRLLGGLRTMTTGALLGIGAKIGTSVMSGIQSAIQGGWESALDIDTATRVLEGMYETPAAAQDMLASLREVSSASSIDHSSYLEAAQSLAYTGVQGESAVQIMENVGLAALASGKDGDQAFTSMNGALARMVNEGKVGLQSLQQLSGAGVPILSGLADHFGVSMEEVNKMATAGAIDFEDVLSVMENATGDYFQTALVAGEDASLSLENQLKRIKDDVFTTVGESLAPILAQMDWQAIGDQVASLAESFTALVPLLMDVAMWIMENSDWLAPLAGIIGGVTAAMWLLNAAMAANPFMLLAGAAVALVAGLVLFFTKTETGQRIWESFTDALSTGWEWVKGAFAAAWDFIQPILDGLWTALKVVGAILLTAVVVPFQIGWSLVSAAISFAWNSIIKPAWDAMQIGLQVLGSFFTWVWNTIIQPVWNALGAGIAWVWNTIIKPAWDALKVALGAVGSFFQWVWNSVIKPAWDALGAGIQWVWQNVISPAWDALKTALGAVGTFFQWVWNSVIKPAWDALGAGIRWVADNVVHPVFEGLKRGVELVGEGFSKAVDWIAQVWDRIKEITSAPVRFVIDTVYNDGIRAVWNKVAGWLDLKELDEWRPTWMGGYASGGVLPGYTPGRDIYEFVEPRTGLRLGLGGGEGIMRPEFVDMVGGPKGIDDLNMRARKGLPLGHAGNYRAGGVLPGWEKLTTDIQRAMAGSVAQAFPNQVITSGTRYHDVGAGYDNHMQGRAVDFGLPGGPLASWIAREYGPSVLELFWDPGPNMVGGAPTGAIGGHSDHVHWAMATIIDPYTGDVISEGGQGGGGVSPIGGLVRAAFDSIISPIMDKFPTFGGTFGEMPKALGTKMVDGLRDFIMAKIPGGGGSSDHGDWVGTPGVEQFRPLVERLLRLKGHDVGLTGSVLRRMNQESSGNPNNINLWDSNAMAGWPTKGLMQMRDDTFASNADPGFTNIWDPESNIRSSMNYAISRYGSLSAAYDRAGGYDEGGWLMPGTTLSINETDKPEAVLTNPQWRLIADLVMATAELLDPFRQLARDGRDMARHIEELADNSRRQVAAGLDAAGLAVWEALPVEMQDAITAANAAGRMWDEISHRLADKALAWSKGEWPIGSARTPTVEPGPGWEQFHLDDSLQKVARSNLDLAEAVIAGELSAGSDPVANAIYDVFGRDPILPDLARIAAGGENAIVAATEAAWHAFETGETARLEEWTDSNSQLTEAVLRARDAAIVTGEMVQGAVNGYLNWAMASDSQGRQGSWQEYFQHYGGEYGTAQGDWLLSQVGLGGIIGGKFKDSFANLLIETAQSPILSAPPILDSDGRVIGTQLQSETGAGIDPRASTDALSADLSTATQSLIEESEDLDATAEKGEAKSVTVVMDPDKSSYTAEEVRNMVGALDEKVDDLEFRIEDATEGAAPLGLGVGGIA